MIRRPPGSTRTDTLFPYTTLFRSVGIAGEGDVAAPFEHRGQAVEGLAPHDHRAAHGELLEAAEVGGQVPRHLAAGADHAVGGAGEDQRDFGSIDRKSTRLNSSH